MKHIRRLLPLALSLALCLSLVGTAAADSSKFASLLKTPASYSSTQSFLNALDEVELPYEYLGLTDNEDEEVLICYPGDNLSEIYMDVFFGPDEDDVYFRVWNLIDFNSSDYRELLGKVNELNDDYNFASFILDTSDYSVTVELDSLLPEDGGDMCLDYVSLLGHITDRAYQVLAPYAIN